jgi:Flp pilus assembly protein TadG
MRKGQTTVEFALAVLVLFTFVFAFIDFGVMFYVNLTMQHAVREGVRQAITGNSTGGDRRSLLISTIRNYSNGLYDKNRNPQKDPVVSVITPSAATYANYTGTRVNDTGRPDDIITVSLTYSWPLLTPILKPLFSDGAYTFTVGATMKNEPWGT